jgi:hypothetical protein
VNTKNSLYYFINRFVIKVSEGMEFIFGGSLNHLGVLLPKKKAALLAAI